MKPMTSGDELIGLVRFRLIIHWILKGMLEHNKVVRFG